MIVYQTNEEGYFLWPVAANESPLEPGVFAIPGGCVETAPPEFGENQRARWTGEAWVVEDLQTAGPEEEGGEVPSIEQLRVRATADLIAMINAAADALISGVPVAEMLSWGVKEAAARKVIASETLTDYETAILLPEAELTGETLAELAARVVMRGDQYRAAVSAMSGVRRAGEAAIAAAEDAAGLAAALGQAGAQLQAVASGGA